MDASKQDHRQAITRLALCVVIAAALYAALDKWGDRLPLPAALLQWVRENKVPAIALAAAACFGLSLALFPAETETDDQDPCAGYQRADGTD